MEHLFKKFLATLVTLAMVLSVVTMAGFNTVSAKAKKKVNSVTVTNIDNNELTLEEKETFTLKTEVSVTGKASKKVTYKSSNKNVAKVSSKGKITAKKAGTAKITVASKANKKKKVVIKVTVVKAAEQTSTTEQESGAEEEATDDDSNDQQQTEENLPAANFKDDDSKVAVAVKAPVGALPEGASMKVTDVDVKDVKEAVKDVVDADDMQAIDISFKDTDGKEIEPKKDVTVELTADVVSKPNLKVVHIDDNGKATIVENVKIDADKATLTFKQDEFSTFVLTWTADENASATIHYGYMDGNKFVEFDKETSLDTSVGSFSLHSLYDGYTYQQPYYSATELSNPTSGTAIGDDIFKVTGTNDTYTWEYTDAESESKRTIANGSHIYAVYMKLPEEVQPDPDVTEVDADEDPLSTEKSVVANLDENGNPDGTYKISLSITGAVETETIHPTADVIIVFDRSGSMRFRGTSSETMYYGPGRRDYTAIQATKSLTTELLKNNTEKYPDTIHMSIVEFGNDASTVITNSKDETQLLNAIDDLRGENAGTNWQRGLQVANGIQTREGSNVYVIFVSDGNPTFYGTRPYGNGQETTNNINTCYDQARGQARNIVQAGKNFYTLGVFGSVDRMQHLTAYAYSGDDSGTYPAGRYQTATDTDSLNAAFAKIIEDINNSFGYTDVEIDDGVTEMTSIATQVSGATGNFVYTRDGGTNEDGSKKYDNETWTNAPAASASENGVAWDLGAEGAVEAGVTYTVSFDVWPSQESYDLVADLNNGLVDYETLDKSVKDQIQDNGNGTYSLLTNTYLNTTYTFKGKKYKVLADKGEKAMALDDETIKIVKYFENKLDSQKLDKIKLTVTKAGSDYMDVDLSEDDGWEKDDIFISCGLMTVEHNELSIKETGHEYSVSEHNDEDDFHWDLEATIYRPMVINGVTTMLVKVVDDDEISAHSSLADNKTDGTYYKFDGTLYKVESQSNVISAYNRRRSNLNLTKAIQGKAPADALYEYTAKIGKTGDDDIWFSAWDPEANALVNDLTVSSNVTAATGDSAGYFYVKAGEEFKFSIKAGWNVRFINLPIETEYTITETIEDDFNIVSIEAKAIYGQGTKEEKEVEYNPTITLDSGKVVGSIENSNTSYTLTYTNEMKYFYVYHSSDNTTERISVDDERVQNDKFNIVDETKAGYIYGGYYQEYTDAGMSDDEIVAAEYKNDDKASYTYVAGKTGAKGNWMTDSEGSPYTGKVATTWNGEKAYTDDKGTEMKPVSGTVYYLKEVPEAYLKPVVYFVYNISARDDNGEHYKPLEQMYFITTVDDGNYESIGLNVTGTTEKIPSSSTLKSTITVKQEGKTYAKIKAENTNSVGMTGMTIPRGYMAYWNVDKLMTAGSTYTVNPYFVTLDGVTVNSAQIRTAIIPAESTVTVNGVDLKVLKRADLDLDSANNKQDSTYK